MVGRHLVNIMKDGLPVHARLALRKGAPPTLSKCDMAHAH